MTWRDDVVAEARRWVGTPFHDNAQLFGVGVDCAHLLAAVYEHVGLVPELVVEEYSPQFMLHRDEQLFEEYVLRFADRIEESAVLPGDIVLWKVGRSFAHGGIVVDWPSAVIHAFKTFGVVAETPGSESTLLGRETRFYSLRLQIEAAGG